MAPAQTPEVVENGPVGPHPSYIQVAKPYIFEKYLQDAMTATGVTEAKEDTNRLQGIQWIDNVRRALQLYVTYVESVLECMDSLANTYRPVRTFNTAAVYYHKFRLRHNDNEYGFIVGCFSSHLLSRLLLSRPTGCSSSRSFYRLQN